MNDDLDENLSDGNLIVCSECGEDVRIREDTRRAWSHRSRVIPFVVWVTVLLAVLVSASPWGQGQLGTRFAVWETTESRVPAEPMEYLQSTVSMDQLRAADDDIESRKNLTRWIGDLVDGQAEDDPLVRIWFVATRISGGLIVDQRYGFGGIGYSLMELASLSDVRDLESYSGITYSRQKSNITWFPLVITKINSGGSKVTTTTYDPIGVMAQLAVCMVLVFVLLRIGKLLGIKIGQGKRGRWVLLVLLLIGTGVYGALHPIDYGSVYLGGIERTRSGEYSLGEIRAALDDPDAMSVLIESIAEQLEKAKGSDGALLSARVDRGYVSHTENWLGSLGRYVPLAKFTKRTYYERESVDERWRIEPPAHLRSARVLDISGAYWWGVRLNGKNALYWIGFSPGYLILFVVSFYWLWRLVHGIARRILRRVQRRRFGHDQCVLCAYPLSEEGMVARAGGIES